MKKPTDIGMNRTGIDASPIDSKKTQEGALEAELDTRGDEQLLAQERIIYAQRAEPVGTMPMPASVKGAVTTAVEGLKGNQPNVFIDKLGERLAYERTGVRLYEALLCKHAAAELHEGGPTVEELEEIRQEELQHFGMLAEAIKSLGADPTAMTPCADVTAVASSGALKVLTDPRTTLTQCLDVMLTVELTDNDAWLVLTNLAEGLGKNELAEQFRQAMLEEQEHLARVRAWTKAALVGQAGIAPTREKDQSEAQL